MIRERIKEETREMHQALEDISHGDKIMSGRLTKDEYAEIIRMNYGMNKAFESQWSELSFDIPDTLLLPMRSKLTALEKDMELLGLSTELTTDISFPATTYPQFIGSLYVFEGSTLGGAVILKQLRKNENLKEFSDFNFYDCYGDRIGMLWKIFLDHLTAITNEAEVDECIAAANQTFSTLKDYMTSVSAQH